MSNASTIIGGTLAVILLVIILVTLGSLFWGCVVYALYNWLFLTCLAGPVFGLTGLAKLTFLQSWGIGLILSIISSLLRGGSSN